MPSMHNGQQSTVDLSKVQEVLAEKGVGRDPLLVALVGNKLKQYDENGDKRLDHEEVASLALELIEEAFAVKRENDALDVKVERMSQLNEANAGQLQFLKKLITKAFALFALVFAVSMGTMGGLLAKSTRDVVESSKEAVVDAEGKLRSSASGQKVQTEALGHKFELGPLIPGDDGLKYACVPMADIAAMLHHKEEGGVVALDFHDPDNEEVIEIVELRGGAYTADEDGVQLGNYRADYADARCQDKGPAGRNLMELKTARKQSFHRHLQSAREGVRMLDTGSGYSIALYVRDPMLAINQGYIQQNQAFRGYMVQNQGRVQQNQEFQGYIEQNSESEPDMFQGYIEQDSESEPDGGQERRLDELTYKENIRELVENIDEDVDLAGIHYKKDGLLSKEECEALIRYYDEHTQAKASTDPFQKAEMRITTDALTNVIGAEAFQGILAFLYVSVGEAPVSSIVLRRTYADGVNKVGMMHWHMHEKIPGFKESTVAVALNADADVTGGSLYFLAQDGPVEAPRAQGRGYAFPYNSLHTVGDYSGTRYSLYVHVNHDLVGSEFE